MVIITLIFTFILISFFFRLAVKYPFIESWFGIGGLVKYPIITLIALSFLLAVALARSLINYAHGQRSLKGNHGTAEWGSRKQIKGLIDKNYKSNILLTATERLALTKDMGGTAFTMRNNNVLVIGASGSGKSQSFAKPQIYQAYSSYVVTDPKAALYNDTKGYLEQKGYDVRLFDLVNMGSSLKYNPMAYIETTDDILKLTNNIIANTNGKSESGDFWERAESALLQAVISYAKYESGNMLTTLHDALTIITKASGKNGSSEFDVKFQELKDKSCFAYRQYEIFKLAPDRTRDGILISAAVRLAAFNIPEIAELTKEDTLALKTIGSRKTALFIVISDVDASKNFLSAILYQQLFDILVREAGKSSDGRLSAPITFILDEFANIGKIPRFDNLIATVRSRGICIMILIQSLSQLKSAYPDTWETISGNCDSLLYLGGMEKSTHEYISQICGTTTQIQEQAGHGDLDVLGNKSRSSFNRNLIMPDEVARLDPFRCILKISGLQPYMSRKYALKSHPAFNGGISPAASIWRKAIGVLHKQ